MKPQAFIPTGPFPLIPMRNMVLFPNQTMPIVVGRSRSRQALEKAIGSDRWVVLVAQKADHHSDNEPEVEDLYHVGTLARIDHYDGGQDKVYHAAITGIARFHISNFKDRGYWEVE